MSWSKDSDFLCGSRHDCTYRYRAEPCKAKACREAGFFAAIFAVAGRFTAEAVAAAAGRFFGAMRRRHGMQVAAIRS